MHFGSGKEIRYQFGERPGVNRPVGRWNGIPVGSRQPLAMSLWVGCLFAGALLTLGAAAQAPKLARREPGGLTETGSEHFLLTMDHLL
jgi:hypothetical protein